MNNFGKVTKNVTGVAFIIMGISIVSKILGLVRESVMAASFGASAQTDAYRVAFGIPSILLAFISATIATTFIPVYTEYKKNKTKEQCKYFVNNIFNVVIVLSFLLTILGIILAPILVKVIAPGFNGKTYNLAVKLSIIVFPTLIFFTLSNLATGYLQSNYKFFVPMFIWIPYNLIIIGSIVFFSKLGIEIIAVGSIIAVISLLFVQLPSMIKSEYHFKLVINLKEKGLGQVFILSVPVFISSAFTQIYIFIDRILASGLDEGSISALIYANEVNQVIYNIFFLSIITVIYPKLSFISDNMSNFRIAVEKGIKFIILISLPTTIGIFILRTPIISILFEKGAFDSRDTYTTSIALACFSIGIIGIGLRELLNRAFYSIKDTKTPMINGIIVICINIVLDIILVKFWGVAGLAISTSISAVIGSGMMLVRFGKKIGIINGIDISVTFLKTITASLLMGIVVYFLNNNFFVFGSSFIFKTIRLTMSICIGGLTYFFILIKLKVDEVFMIIYIIKNKAAYYWHTSIKSY